MRISVHTAVAVVEFEAASAAAYFEFV